jgi:lysozyme family protein
MANFFESYNKTMKVEGGYANSKHDRGGETWRGISRVFWPNWEGWAIIDSYKPITNTFEKNLALDQKLDVLVKNFYKQNFWDIMCLDQCNSQVIANELFDTGVNCGTKVPAKFLQKTLNRLNRQQTWWKDIAEDGAIGNQTISTLNISLAKHSRMELAIARALNGLQTAYYFDITPENDQNEFNLLGWLLDRVVL